jgi:hypothetical protein
VVADLYADVGRRLGAWQAADPHRAMQTHRS